MEGTSFAARLGRLGVLPRPLLWAVIALVGLFVWYGVIGGLRAGVSPDLALKPGAELRPAGSSAAIAYAARLVEREAGDRAFTPNDPLLYPTAFARRTAAFQRAVIATVAAVLPALPAVEQAQGERLPQLFADASEALATPPDRYWLALALPPIRRPAERRYLDAVTLLAEANGALAREEQAAFAGHAPAGALRALALQLVEAAERGEVAIRAGAPARQVLASQRGTAFAAAMMLKGLREDHAARIRASAQAARWAIAADALERAARVDPMFSSRSGLVEAGFALLIAARELDALAADTP